MRYAVFAVLFLTAPVSAQNPQTIAFTAGYNLPCDGSIHEGYWGNVTGQDVRLESLRLQQRQKNFGAAASALTTMSATVYISHPNADELPRRTVLKAEWGPDAEPIGAHSTVAELGGGVIARHGDFLTLSTTCMLVSGVNTTHDATAFLTLVHP